MKSKHPSLGCDSQTPVRGAREGLIVAHLGVAVEVLFDDGARQAVRVKRNSGHVVGDGVRVRDEVLERLPRRTQLCRGDTRGGTHLVGANLDVLGVVVAPLPLPPPGFVDRAIVAARAAGLQPFLVLNKCDLAEAAALEGELGSRYGAAIPLFVLSAARGEGLEPLRRFLAAGHRGAFVGTTGVGKSSLLNALCPRIDLKVGAMSDYGLGRHTTTVATLHGLADGGELVDTPGFRDFGLVDISVPELAAHFPGFEPAATVTCRFRDCRHGSEPGCAVAQLVAQGEIPAERMGVYLELLAEVAAEELKQRSREWKS